MNIIEKEIIRKQYISIRNKMGKGDLLYKSQCISEKLSELECIKNAVSIMCYVSFENEVESHSLISDWLSQGKKVSVPYVSARREEGRHMHAIHISGLSELSPGSYGILEPKFDASKIIALDTLDAIIVPGVAFDIKKNRMGYGGGYYDNYLKNISSKCSKIGVCYDFQVLDQIPVDDYDVPLDILVTENRIL